MQNITFIIFFMMTTLVTHAQDNNIAKFDNKKQLPLNTITGGIGRARDVEQIERAKETINAVGRPVVTGAEAIRYLDIPFARHSRDVKLISALTLNDCCLSSLHSHYRVWELGWASANIGQKPMDVEIEVHQIQLTEFYGGYIDYG